MDFTQVKSLTIPEGDVTKITDSSGRVLWQKITQGWHTLWEGNATSHNGSSPVDVAKLSELSGTVTLRVTWSCAASGGDDAFITYYYNNNGSTGLTTTKPDDPFQFDLDADRTRFYIIGGARLKSGNNSMQGRRCYLKWSTKNKLFTLATETPGGGDGGVDLSVSITKIEQYY